MMDTYYPINCFYEVGTEIIKVDEKGKEKRSKESYIVDAKSTDEIQSIMDKVMEGTMNEWEIVSIKKTNICGLVQK